jgi:hypothetical protein
MCFVVTGVAAQQEAEPLLIVETLGIEPTVAMTGDILTATYRVRFQDLVAQGKEIVVVEDRMAPDKLPLAPFEGLGLDVDKQQIGSEHVWEFRYRLRLIGPEKGIEALRTVTFFYLIRDLGQKIEDARVLQVETMPLEVRYVTTMTSEQVLDIHDRVELGSFGGRIALLRGLAWLIAPLPLLLWTVGTLRAGRRPTPAREAAALDSPPDDAAPLPPSPTVAQARQALLRCLRQPATSGAPLDERMIIAFQRDLVIALRSYLLAEIPSLNPGDTAKDIRRQVETMAGETHRVGVMKQLAARLVLYQTALERGEPAPVSDLVADARAIEMLISDLGWRSRIVDAISMRFQR